MKVQEVKVKLTVEGKIKNNKFTYTAITNFKTINKLLYGMDLNKFHITKELVLV